MKYQPGPAHRKRIDTLLAGKDTRRRLRALYARLCPEAYEFSGDDDLREAEEEIAAIITASSTQEGGKVVAWWGCWTRKDTQTKFARTVRDVWCEMCGVP